MEANVLKFQEKVHKVPNLGELTGISWSIVKDVMTSTFTHFPRKLGSATSYILTTQYRLTPLTKKKSLRYKFVYDHDFSTALKFLKIRALINSELKETYYMWENIEKQARKNRSGHKPRSPYSAKRKYSRRQGQERGKRS
jgi:poly(A) polymerase